MEIKVRPNALNPKTISIPRKSGESVKDTFDRYYYQGFKTDDHIEYFEILVNGHLIDRGNWDYICPSDTDEVLIALTPKGGSSRDFFRTAAILAISVGAAYATAGASYWVQAGVTIGSTWLGSSLVNSLIPPLPQSMGGTQYNSESSQTFTIAGQTNTLTKYGSVPRVYGEHRVFPRIAANPYTEFQSEAGEVVQYFYAVYDFGLGPTYVDVGTLKIGDTSITDFEGVNYNLVDFNRPVTSEGLWDEMLASGLSLYTGDVNQTDVSATLNDDGDIVTRSAVDNLDSASQQISCVFLCPQGLTSFNSRGDQAAKSMDLSIQFAEVGTENWKAYNDLSVVSDFSVVGSTSTVTEAAKSITLYVPDVTINPLVYPNYSLYTKIGFWANYTTRQITAETGDDSWLSNFSSSTDTYTFYKDLYGMRAGEKTFYSRDLLNIDDIVLYNGRRIGTIGSRSVYSGDIYQYWFYNGISETIGIFEDYVMFHSSIYAGALGYTTWQWNVNGTKQPRFLTNLTLENNTAGNFNITGAADATDPAYFYLKFNPYTTSQVKVKVERIRTTGGYDYRELKDLSWLNLTTKFNSNPIQTSLRHTFLEIKIKATDQLNGSLQNLSAVCTSVLNTYNGSAWSLALTKNPAWVFVDLLTGTVNKRAVSLSRLDADAIKEWADFCDVVPTSPSTKYFDAPRFECSFVLDYNITLAELITRVTTAAQASLTLYSGKYGVLIDQRVTTPVQVFTPRNSWGFNSSRSYVESIHALKVKYVDPIRGWEVQEEIVYDDGYNVNNATLFEEVETFGCTSEQQAWRYGRFLLAQGRLRQETVSLTVDFENLVCTRGDYVLFQQDVMLVGGNPARVTDVSGTTITIDDKFVTAPATSYGYTLRNSSTITTSTMTILTSTTATVDGTVPNIGDLIVWGEVGSITIDMVVKNIVPNDDLTASITLVEKADAIYDAESTDTLPDYDPQIGPSLDYLYAPPGEVGSLTVTENTWECFNGGYRYYVLLTWSAPTDSVVDQYEIHVNDGTGSELYGFSAKTSKIVYIDNERVDVEHSFKVLGVASNGNKLALASVTAVTATPTTKSASPSDVETIYSNILNETLQLDWELVSDCDILYYQVRYSPNLNAIWSNSIPLQKADRNTSLVSVQARTGTYLVKAFDWNGNESENAVSVITSIPDLTGLNFIDETNDFPSLPGVFTQTVNLSGGLILQEESTDVFYSEGYYEFSDLLDLTDIYTVRLQSLIDVEGYAEQDIMANWVTLDAVEYLTSARVSDWDVETQYRSTAVLQTISNWTTLDSVPQMSSGVPEYWTPWRKFTIGDFTGRIFNFRLKLKSNKANISPRVFDGIIKIDMPDRFESYQNEVVGVSGKTITYSPAFKGPDTSPVLSITMESASQGDYFVLTSKTLAGFTITCYDKTDTAVERTVDILAQGFGRLNSEII